MPHLGVNALYAADMALAGINSLRETFKDDDHIRIHAVITEGSSCVNVIPDKVCIESYIRGAIMEANNKVNRVADACAAASKEAYFAYEDKRHN